MLESDAVKFDQFLRENEAKVNESIKVAEAEAKRRADKQIEIKRLHAKIAASRSDVSKHLELLADCKKYRQFLDDITPAAHFAEQQRALAARRAATEAAWQHECAAVRDEKAAAHAAKAQAEADYSNARTQQEADRATEAFKQATEHLKAVLPKQEPPRPPLEEASTADAEAMYFERPAQLQVRRGSRLVRKRPFRTAHACKVVSFCPRSDV